MGDSQISTRIMPRIQQPFLIPPAATRPLVSEPKGVVYTKRWVVDLLLDLAGYTSASNLIDSVAIEPAAGDGAFLGPMIERLLDSCQRLGQSVSACKNSLIAYELNEAMLKLPEIWRIPS